MQIKFFRKDTGEVVDEKEEFMYASGIDGTVYNTVLRCVDDDIGWKYVKGDYDI